MRDPETVGLEKDNLEKDIILDKDILEKKTVV